MSTFHKVESPSLLTDGTVTVLLKSGRHYTYDIHTVRSGDLKGKRIVSLLTGPDNNASYRGFGFIWVDEKEDSITKGMPLIAVWKKCRTEAFEKHAALLCGMANEHVVEWMQSGSCRKCGRKLTTPESLKAGIGPVCAGRE